MELIKNKQEFILYTVPHTGTFFTFRFLRFMGYSRCSYTPQGKIGYRHIHPRTNHVSDQMDMLLTTKLLVNARHPYHNLFSFMSRRTELPVQTLIVNVSKIWDQFLSILDQNPNHFILNVNTPVEQRRDHLYDVARFIGTDVSEWIDHIDQYAANWEPRHTFKPDDINPHHAAYITDPSIMDQYDLTPLDNALDWFNSIG